MEEFENRKTCPSKKCYCLDIIVTIIFALFLGTLGLILGAVFAIVLTANLAVLITAAVLLAVAMILLVIYKLCLCKKGYYK